MKVLTLALLAVALVLSACGDDTDAAAQTTTTTDAASELPEVLQRYYDAYIDGDAVALAALFTDDGVLEGPAEGDVRMPLSAPGGISMMMTIWFSYVDVTDIDVTEVITMGNTIVVVSRGSGDSSTHARGPGGHKTPYSAPAVDVFELDGDLIARCDGYFEYDAVAT